MWKTIKFKFKLQGSKQGIKANKISKNAVVETNNKSLHCRNKLKDQIFIESLKLHFEQEAVFFFFLLLDKKNYLKPFDYVAHNT